MLAQIPSNVVEKMVDLPVYLRVTGTGKDVEYYIEDKPMVLKIAPSPEQIQARLVQLEQFLGRKPKAFRRPAAACRDGPAIVREPQVFEPRRVW